MDDGTVGVQESSDMCISSDDDGIKQQNERCAELEHEHSEAQPDALVAEPELGMAFDTENEVREYYIKYAKAKGFGVTRRSSHSDDNGQLKYLTLSCSRYGKTQSKSRNMLKPNPTAGIGCKAKINIARGPDGKLHLSTAILDHNHTLSPQKSRLFRCNKKLDFHVKRRLELNDRAGIRVNKNFNSFVVAADGHDSLTFGEKNCRNFLEKTRRLKLGSGDAEAVCDYFVKMQSANPNFFSVMDVDDESRLRNVFWADARSRAVYESFHDVITFDTTYLMNKYDMPFACFVGVNHHGHSVLLGCALLSNEDTATFVWLFQAWLTCMSNRRPKAIITDQAKAIQNGVEEVFPKSRYRWCLWHIMKKIPEKLGGYDEYDHIKVAIGNAVYDSLTITEFEVAWMHMLEKYCLADNEWLKGLYEHRHRWVPAFVKDAFWAGMSTTQRSESMNAFFDGYVNAKTTLKHFVTQYENALRDKVEKENIADFNSFYSTIPCITRFDIEKQFQSAYTNSKFKEFQEELTDIMYCDRKLIQKQGAIATYEITEDVLIDKEKGWRKDIVYHVYFNEEEFEVKCSCRRFEFRGILCRHILCVLTHMKIKEVPPQYIHDRWKKNVKRKHNFIRCTYGGMEDTPVAKRFDRLCESFYPIAEIGAMSDASCNSLTEKLHALKIEYSSNSISENDKNQVGTQEDAPSDGKTTSKTIRSPIPVRCAGRPPSLRKESKVDKLIRQANDKKKKAEQRDKKKAEQEKKKAEQRDKKKAEQEKKKAEQKAHSTNLNNKRCNNKRKQPEDDIVQQDVTDYASQEGVYLQGGASSSIPEGSFEVGTTTGNINPTPTAAIPYGGSSTMVMPPILEEYTSMLFQVQQGSTPMSGPTELHFDGTGGLNNTTDQS
ncbi:protein FAR1-RELATED SEQUENCE 6-like [Triticum dicoccoides]|uniref:protein FAR1-RELATED SEQUENCE 6-like n=1 Tax=Triticum dicoccoides TaxID=85692 RepID=UPI0018903E41|nr:protein FAR1-RELATED SEQUENCE 6-like [Triticum dicoccoides]